MATTIQIRDVPEDVHRRLKARAAGMGLSLSQFMLQEATRIARQPTLEELRERFERLPKHPELRGQIADIIRDGRERR